jgi:hypothetical protein
MLRFETRHSQVLNPLGSCPSGRPPAAPRDISSSGRQTKAVWRRAGAKRRYFRAARDRRVARGLRVTEEQIELMIVK